MKTVRGGKSNGFFIFPLTICFAHATKNVSKILV